MWLSGGRLQIIDRKKVLPTAPVTSAALLFGRAEGTELPCWCRQCSSWRRASMWQQVGQEKRTGSAPHTSSVSEAPPHAGAEKIENVHVRSPLVAQSFVYGDSLRSKLVAVVVPDPEALLPWAASRDLPRDLPALCQHSAVRAAVLRSILEEGRTADLRGFEQARAVPGPSALPLLRLCGCLTGGVAECHRRWRQSICTQNPLRWRTGFRRPLSSSSALRPRRSLRRPSPPCTRRSPTDSAGGPAGPSNFGMECQLSVSWVSG